MEKTNLYFDCKSIHQIVLQHYLIVLYKLFLIQLMSEQKQAQPSTSFKIPSQNHNKEQSLQQKSQEPPNNYSFNSFHMNIISDNKGVQGLSMTPPMYQPQNNEFMNFYGQPQVFQQAPQYPSSDIQVLLNNMFMVLNNQSKLLAYLIDKNDHNFSTTNKIYDQVKTIKQKLEYCRKQQDELVQQQPVINNFKQPSYNAGITANDLVSILYGPKTIFKFRLIVDSKVPFQVPLYRQRNFRLKINLMDENGKLFQNSNKIPISLALYTVQNPPKFLQSNTLGNKMLKGYTQQDLINRVCSFQKIQIKEVTSHYRKNMLFLVAFAKMPSLGCIQDNGFVQYSSIRPLVIDRVVVKAKKMKSNVVGKQKQHAVEKQSPEQSQKIIDGQNDQL